MKIVILEDNEDRVAVMKDCLSDKLSSYEAHFFDESSTMVAFLETCLADVIAVSLDHDLEMKEDEMGRAFDAGTGRAVAEFLAGKVPAFPIVIHTTNSSAGLAMEMLLQESKWKTYRVIPFDDTTWIGSDWLPTLRRAILGKARAAKQAPR